MMKGIINKLSKNLHLFVYLRKIIEFYFYRKNLEKRDK